MTDIIYSRISEIEKDMPVKDAPVRQCLNEISAVVNGGIEEDNIISKSLGEDVFKNSAVTNRVIATDAVSTDKIQNKAVTAQKLSDSIPFNKLPEVEAGKILIGNGDTPSYLAAQTVSGDITIDKNGVTKIGDGKVIDDMLDTGAVTTKKIANAAVTSDKLGMDAVLAGKIKNGEIKNEKIANDAAIASKKILFSVTAGHKSAADAYWEITTKDAWVQCKVEDKLPVAATKQDILVFIQIGLRATGPAGAVCQVALRPNSEGGTWNADNVSCPQAIFVIPSTGYIAAGASVIPVQATWDEATSGHYFWYQFRDSHDITGGSCFLAALSWIAFKPY